MTPLLYAVPVIAAAGGLYLWKKKKAPASTQKGPDVTATATAAGYAYGCAIGKGVALGTASPIDFASDAAAMLEASKSGYPTQWVAGASDGYTKCYQSNLPSGAEEDSTPDSGGGTKGDKVKAAVMKAGKGAAQAAWLDGCIRGAGFGWADAANGYESNPTPSSSKFSTADANNAYVTAYKDAYRVAYNIRDKMSGLPGYGEGESTTLPSDSSAISNCNSNFESWWVKGAKVAGSDNAAHAVKGFLNRVGSVSTFGYLVAGLPGATVGAVVGGCSKVPMIADAADQHVGRHVRRVVPQTIRDRVTGMLPMFGAGVTGFAVAGFPGAAIASCGHMALTHDGTMYDRAKRVFPVAVASVTGLFVAGVPGAIVAGLAVAGVTHKSSIDIAKVTGDIRTGALKADKATVLANALEAKGNRTGANAIRAELASAATSRPVTRSNRMPAAMRKVMGR
jgi:hypothetical protein